MRFSFILPIYNVEKYIDSAIESVLCQSYKDFEIILVDDGSPDKCPEICDTWAKKDSRIKVIHKVNGGISDARNAGTDVAGGDYIIYLDSDDKWIDSDGLKFLSGIIDKEYPDLIIFGVNDYYPETGKSVLSRGNYNEIILNSKSAKAVIDTLINQHNFPGAVWMLAIKRQFIERHNLCFNAGVTAEDFDWIIKAFSQATSIKVLNRVIYQYRYTNSGSITSKPRLSGILGIHNAISNWLKDEKISQYQSISNYLCGIYLQALLVFAGLDNNDQRSAIEILKNDKLILSQSDSFKFKLINYLIDIIGIRKSSILLRSARKCLK